MSYSFSTGEMVIMWSLVMNIKSCPTSSVLQLLHIGGHKINALEVKFPPWV